MREELESLLTKQGYKVVGDHAGVKLCHWTKADLRQDARHCYKGDFYGIESRKCMQMTPVVDYCNFRCLYCWRSQDFDNAGPREWDDPEAVFAGCSTAQRELLSGYKGHDMTDLDRWMEANRPKHVAISLNGEPTAYPHLADFIKLCHAHDMTTFLVTNGSIPEAIRRLEAQDALPTQLYVSVDAPNEEIFNKLCVPLTHGAWDKLLETLDLCAEVDTRTVARHTLVKGWNMGHYEEYAALDERMDADFIECKGYVHVGYSRERMEQDNMPSFEDVRQFSQRLADALGYDYTAARPDSRVALLVKPGVNRWLEGHEPEHIRNASDVLPEDEGQGPQGLSGFGGASCGGCGPQEQLIQID